MVAPRSPGQGFINRGNSNLNDPERIIEIFNKYRTKQELHKTKQELNQIHQELETIKQDLENSKKVLTESSQILTESSQILTESSQILTESYWTLEKTKQELEQLAIENREDGKRIAVVKQELEEERAKSDVFYREFHKKLKKLEKREACEEKVLAESYIFDKKLEEWEEMIRKEDAREIIPIPNIGAASVATPQAPVFSHLSFSKTKTKEENQYTLSQPQPSPSFTFNLIEKVRAAGQTTQAFFSRIGDWLSHVFSQYFSFRRMSTAAERTPLAPQSNKEPVKSYGTFSQNNFSKSEPPSLSYGTFLTTPPSLQRKGLSVTEEQQSTEKPVPISTSYSR